MSKKYRVYAIAAAQGLEKSNYIDKGYVSDKFTTNQESYQDTYDYPVSLQFEELPNALRGLSPIGMELNVCVEMPGSVTISKNTVKYWADTIQKLPSNAELLEIAKESARVHYLYISQRILTSPIDINGGVFSCKSDGETIKVYPSNIAVSLGNVYTGQGAPPYNPITYAYYRYADYTATISGEGVAIRTSPYNTINAITNGISLNASSSIENIKIIAPSEQHPAYIDLEYYEGGRVTYPYFPAGYVNEEETLKFSWHTTYSGFPIEDITPTSTRLEWKDGEAGTVHTVSLSGNLTEYTMPANTLPESTNILWRVVVQTAEGSSTSAWTTIQTVDSPSTVQAILPSAIYVDGMQPMHFEWNHMTDTGTAQTAYDLQYKTSTIDWTTVQHEETSNEYCDLPAGALPSGSLNWRVRTYNAEGIAGDWSNELTIVVIAAPSAPSVSVSVSAPRPVIAWQSREQQAFEVEIGTHKSGTVFGTSKTYQSPVYLADGLHVVRVRVLNEFNIWSTWGETTLTVTNVPGETPATLDVTADIDAQLTWSEVPNTAEYIVFRNGERIARINGTTYKDRTYLGLATYFVRAAHTDGYNYTDSNRVTVNLAVDRVMITALDGDWLDIGYSLTSLPSVSVTRSQDVALMQYAGAILPVPEVSPFERRTYDIKCAFADRQQAARFDDLMARLCCVKDMYGNCIVGILYSYTRAQNAFTTSYSAILYEVDRSAYEEG